MVHGKYYKLAQTVQDNLDGPKWSKNLVSLKILFVNSFGTPCVLKYLEIKTCEDIAISEIITALALPAANYIKNKRYSIYLFLCAVGFAGK